jgi:hypothetical protein
MCRQGREKKKEIVTICDEVYAFCAPSVLNE